MLTIKDLKITTNHTGKMKGMISISTSALVNEGCKKRKDINGSICSKCYACTQLTHYKTQNDCYIKNGIILSGAVYPVEDMPFINGAFIRFEAFGDLINENHFANFVNIAKKNPHATFTLFTKAPYVVESALKNGIEKPDNMIIVVSDLMINGGKLSPVELLAKYPFADKIFIVYDKKEIKEKEIDINCGARSCIGCLNCYKKNDINIMREMLK